MPMPMPKQLSRLGTTAVTLSSQSNQSKQSNQSSCCCVERHGGESELSSTKVRNRNRNRNQATTMHRKTKSKSKTKTTIPNEVITTSSPATTTTTATTAAATATSSCAHYITNMSLYDTQSKSKSKSESESQLQSRPQSIMETTAASRMLKIIFKNNNNNNNNENSSRSINSSSNSNSGQKPKKKCSSAMRLKMLVPLPTLGATSFVTFLTVICIETVLLSTMSSCAKTFYMHWNTSNSIFRIDNTDHIIDVNKGNLAFEFDQVHIICPVYEPGTYENETEKYIIYNVSKVEYETCRITNADPRVIAICDKPQKLMFFTITFRPFTPQPGGLEFLPGNDYYFISTSSKDDLYRRIGGRCSTNNMKVVFKVCCAAEEKNKTRTIAETTAAESADNVDLNANANANANPNGHNVANTIGISGVNTGLIVPQTGIQLKPINGLVAGTTSINSNVDQFNLNRVPLQPNIIGNNIGAGNGAGAGAGGIMLTPGHGSINMLPPGRGGIHLNYPGGNHHHIQTGIRINNVPTQQQQHNNNNQHPPHHKGNNVNTNDDHHSYDKHPNEVVKNEELTYNSGSGRTGWTDRVNGYIWIWMGLSSSVCVTGINSTILIAIMVVILYNYLFDTLAALETNQINVFVDDDR